MPTLKVTNNAATTLASGITNVAVSLTVAGGAGALFPTLGAGDYFYATITNTGGAIERVKVTARATDTFTIVRGQDNSTAQAWNLGDKFELRLVAANIDNFPKLDQANVFSQPQGVGTGVATGDAATVGQWQAQSGIAFQTAGTSTAYTLTPVPAIASYLAGQSFYVTFNAASGAAPTLQISGVATPPNLVKQVAAGTYSNIGAGDIPNNHRSRVTLLSASQALVETMPPATAGGGGRTAPNFANSTAMVAQRSPITVSLSTTRQIGQCDNIIIWASGGAVSAGTLTQITTAISGTTGYAARATGVTLTGSGVISHSMRLESRDAVKYKNKTVSFSVKVDHDVGSNINYTLVVKKPTVADNWTSLTTISTSGTTSVATATGTTVLFEGVSVGDCTNGLELEVQAACGAVTTKNFNCVEFSADIASTAQTFAAPDYAEEFTRCERYLPSVRGVGIMGWGSINSSTIGVITVFFTTPARAVVTGILNSTVGSFQLNVTGVANGALTSLAFTSGSVNAGTLLATTAGGFTLADPCFINSGSYILFTGAEQL